MRCIFCKHKFEESRSVEHILPESMGNKGQVLPKGMVCDQCNNYFSRKVEKQVLESGYFHSLRLTQGVPSKKKKIPIQKAVMTPEIPVELVKEKDGTNVVRVPTEYWDLVTKQKNGKIIFPTTGTKPDQKLMSRFIAKVAVEAFAQRLINKPKLIEEMIDDEQLDPIRQWVRYGKSNGKWLFYERRIYERNKRYLSETGKNYQMVHEYDFLITSANEMYFCIAIFGKEFTINIGGPSIDGYKEWLLDHDNKSPLYESKML